MDASLIPGADTMAAIYHSPEFHQYVHKGLEWVGVFSIAPKLLTALLPQATRLADTVSSLLLRLPVVGPVILQFAPDFIKAFDEVVAAAEKLVDTFRDRLDANIKKAAEEAAAPVPAPTIPPKNEKAEGASQGGVVDLKKVETPAPAVPPQGDPKP